MTGEREPEREPKHGRRFRGQLRWYPMAWRVRYGEELVALMEDTYGDRQPTLRDRAGVARAGLGERLTTFGFASGDPETRTRGGALLVLCGWAFFVVGGIGFAKFAEHWDAATPLNQQRLPADAYNLVAWAAGAAAVILGIAGLVSLPTLLRFIRSGAWTSVRRPVARAAAVTLATALWGFGVILWAHRLTPAQRNGQALSYGIGGGLLAVLVVSTIALWTGAAVATAPRIPWPARILRVEGRLALGMTAAMAAVLGGTVAWWAAEADHAPGFLAGALTGTSGTPAPPALIAIGLCMVAGMALALTGSWWVARQARGGPRSV